MPPPVPRCSGWASSSLISPDPISLPRYGGRVGLHIDLFGACSAFTRVAACTLAQSPIVTDSRRLQPFRYLHDCSDCFRLERIAGWGLHPLESAAFARRTPITAIPVTARVSDGSDQPPNPDRNHVVRTESHHSAAGPLCPERFAIRNQFPIPSVRTSLEEDIMER